MAEKIRALGYDTFEESSVKLGPASREHDRLLLGIARPKASSGFRNALARLCEDLGAESAVRDEFDLRLSESHMVHFGQEGSGAGAIRKVYLEFPKPPDDLPDLRFLGWKWTAGAPAIRALYRRCATPTVAAVLTHLDNLEMAEEVRAGVRRLLEMAADRIAPARVQLLSVAEAGTPRRSFDLNVYDAELTIADCMPALAPACRALGHEPDEIGIARDSRFGHISAGIGRDGPPFLTIYAGARLRRAGP